MAETDEIITAIDNACESLSLREYVDTLEDVISNLETKLEAARADLRREQDRKTRQIMAEKPAPFALNETVTATSDFDHFIRKGQRYFIVSIERCEKSGSGWVVDVAKLRRGRKPNRPALYGTRLDSDWFEKAVQRIEFAD